MRQLSMTIYIKHQQARHWHTKKKKSKSAILDEFCNVTGYSRKHAISVLKHRVVGWRENPPGRSKTYQATELLEPLKAIWFATNQMCGKRLREALPLWLPYYETAYAKLEPKIKELLLAMSSHHR